MVKQLILCQLHILLKVINILKTVHIVLNIKNTYLLIIQNLFVEPMQNDPNNSDSMIYCNPNNVNCSYKLTIKPPSVKIQMIQPHQLKMCHKLILSQVKILFNKLSEEGSNQRFY